MKGFPLFQRSQRNHKFLIPTSQYQSICSRRKKYGLIVGWKVRTHALRDTMDGMEALH